MATREVLPRVVRGGGVERGACACGHVNVHVAPGSMSTLQQWKEENYEEAANLNAERKKIQRALDVFYLMEQV